MNLMSRIQQMGSLMKGMKNPQQTVIQLLENNSNPMAKNVLEMAKKGDTKGIEQFARNVCKEQGTDFEKEFNNFKNNLGM